MLAGSITLLLFGCGSGGASGGLTGDQPTESDDPQLPTTEPAIYGTVTHIQKVPERTHNHENTNHPDPNTPVSSDETTGRVAESGDVIGVVLIEENPDEEYGSQKDSVAITKSTRVLNHQEQDHVSAEFADFEIGQKVRAWYTGPVTESYPRQAMATVVLIESR